MEIKAVVYKKNGKPRKGKGFSRKELEKAGLSMKKP
jgi:ribosomal protein L13E